MYIMIPASNFITVELGCIQKFEIKLLFSLCTNVYMCIYIYARACARVCVGKLSYDNGPQNKLSENSMVSHPLDDPQCSS